MVNVLSVLRHGASGVHSEDELKAISHPPDLAPVVSAANETKGRLRSTAADANNRYTPTRIWNSVPSSFRSCVGGSTCDYLTTTEAILSKAAPAGLEHWSLNSHVPGVDVAEVVNVREPSLPRTKSEVVPPACK